LFCCRCALLTCLTLRNHNRVRPFIINRFLLERRAKSKPWHYAS
jgi:hypothetical protein